MKHNLSITAHMIVQNEEQWVWYAINSVLDVIDKIFIYDTGSRDNTIRIINTIKSSKIVFSQKGRVTPQQLVALRNEQITKTSTEWFMLLDGDEVWTREGLNEHFKIIQRAQRETMGIVVPTKMCVGDLFHVQDEHAGKYELLGKRGHYNIRMYRKKKGYSWKGIYPLEAYTDEEGGAIQDTPGKLTAADISYWHLSLLKRSSNDTHRKRVLEIGKKDSMKLPEVFFKKRPLIVPSPWISHTNKEYFRALVRTPLVYVKRRFPKAFYNLL